MERGRPANIIKWEDIDNIPIKLSFNQIKYLLIKFRNFRTDSVEGKFCNQIIRDFRKFLIKKIKIGNIPPELSALLNEQQKESNNK
jgi:hypothetical protein